MTDLRELCYFVEGNELTQVFSVPADAKMNVDDLKVRILKSSYGVRLYGIPVEFCHCISLSGLGVPDSSYQLASMARLGRYWSCQPPKNVISIFVTIYGHPLVTFSAVLEGSEPFPVQAGIHTSGIDLQEVIWETLSVDHSDDTLSGERWRKLEPFTELAEVIPNLKENSLQVKFWGGPRLALQAVVEGEGNRTTQVVTMFSLSVGLFKKDLLATIRPDLSRAGVEGVILGVVSYPGQLLEESEKYQLLEERLVSEYWPFEPPRSQLSLIVRLPKHDHLRPIVAVGPFEENHALAILSASGGDFIAYDTCDIPRDDDKCDVELEPCTFMEVPWLKALTGIPLSEVLVLPEYELALNAVLEFFERGAYSSQQTNSGFLADGNPFWTHTRRPDSRQLSKIFTLHGHAGIGKTTFLSVVLRLRLEAGLPTLFMNEPSGFYFFSEGKTFEYRVDRARKIRANDLPHLPLTTWCLVKTGRHLEEVPDYLRMLCLFILEAASPRGSHFRRPSNTTTCTQYIMKPWSLKDILSGRQLQQHVHPERVLANAFANFGPSAWIVYSQAGHILTWESRLKSYAQSVTVGALENAINGTNVLPLEGRISPFLLVLRPGKHRADRVVAISTDFIATLISKVIEAEGQKSMHNATRTWNISGEVIM
ncbi:uncharacterized protein LACBIDRAFT_317318 [Laccaria bicolor S238N-H82]|uniref:Predicted protein n=1 Tax=Laccaria bicolor (strain S238N-H82 / ATCC MYA-4686) TaxID=486041 RepID=B0D4W8_LACBS|nr:uncharacterized protein LACBIDRAFT_317318 [Laccaria bicolor S238N-H82]EDR10636.1 predicted protein [Laccaria bicolor S238N-H82]|eukprot:XP_001879086.1 predicted protein [Laccaria bicolor S238N-H82]